jgi:hypothetical protein
MDDELFEDIADECFVRLLEAIRDFPTNLGPMKSTRGPIRETLPISEGLNFHRHERSNFRTARCRFIP